MLQLAIKRGTIFAAILFASQVGFDYFAGRDMQISQHVFGTCIATLFYVAFMAFFDARKSQKD